MRNLEEIEFWLNKDVIQSCHSPCVPKGQDSSRGISLTALKGDSLINTMLQQPDFFPSQVPIRAE